MVYSSGTHQNNLLSKGDYSCKIAGNNLGHLLPEFNDFRLGTMKNMQNGIALNVFHIDT